MTSLLFGLFLILGVRVRRVRRQPSLSLGRHESPSAGALGALHREFFDARDPIHPSARGLVKYLDPVDQVTILRCANASLRFADKATQTDVVRVRQCRSFWCAWCVRLAHAKRTRYQYRKLQSIQPVGEDQVHLLHLVVELPRPLHALVRGDNDALAAWRGAIKHTIAKAYGYEGKHARTASEACWSELGAIFNFHALGDEGTPWPKFFPHYDILLSAYRLHEDHLEHLPTDWPEKFRQTRTQYRETLRKAFAPWAKEDPPLAEFLQSSFPVLWHVSRAPQGAGVGRVHVRTSAHRVRYSCRPLFGLDCCRLEIENGAEVLVYEPTGHRKTKLIHRVPPGPAFGALRSLKDRLAGKHARTLVGTLNGDAYARAIAASGRPAVHEREKTGKKLVGAYLRLEDGSFRYVDPRDVGRL